MDHAIGTSAPTEESDSSKGLIASPWHTLFIVCFLAIRAYWGTIWAAYSRAGFGPSRPFLYLRIIFLEFVALGIVVAGGGHQRGGSPDQSIGYLLPQGSLEMGLWIVVSISAGICEEAIYRGYLQRQLGALTHNAWVGIVLSAATFGGVHIYQGAQRASVIAASAVLFGWFAYWRKTVRPGMFAHAFQDEVAPLLLKMMRG